MRRINTYNRKYFDPAVASADLKAASLWCSNIGRSLSLGNFVAKNLARTPVKGSIIGKQFFVEMLRALMDAESEIATLASDKDTLLLCCTGPSDETEFYWSLPAGSTRNGRS